MSRKSTGKRTRFEVFKRDEFACQYCGGQPPAVVLVVDHIHPIALGGSSTIENLITACETCNQGKADKPLTVRVVRPDADLLYLETQQEIAELRRYQESAAVRDQLIAEIQTRMEGLWLEYSGLDWSPSDRVIRGLLLRYDPRFVEEAVIDVAIKVGSGYIKANGTKWVAYLNVVARNLAAEGSEGE